MTGPEHYREAERLAREADAEDAPEWVTARAALAQVHATLALAAATALTGSMAAQSYTDEPELKVWHEAAGVPEDAEVSDAS